VEGQGLRFSQPYAFRSYLNPAFTAVGEEGRLYAGYMQFKLSGWNNYSAYYAGADYYVDALQGGVAVDLIGERQGEGAIQAYLFGVTYAYQFHVSKKLVASMGLQGQFMLRQYSPSNYVFEDELVLGESQEIVENNARYAPDFSMGGLLSWTQLYLGFSVSHVMSPKMGMQKSSWPRLYGLQAGYRWEQYASNGLMQGTFIPNFLVSYCDNWVEFRPGIYYQNDQWVLGAWGRFQQPENEMGFVGLVGFQRDGGRLAYSYARHVEKFSASSVNSTVHQVTFSMNLQYKQGRKKVRAIKCPTF